jgi:hypothetical protein
MVVTVRLPLFEPVNPVVRPTVTTMASAMLLRWMFLALNTVIDNSP